MELINLKKSKERNMKDVKKNWIMTLVLDLGMLVVILF